MRALVLFVLIAAGLSGCAGIDQSEPELEQVQESSANLEPHVIVGVPDSGINPYHEMYFREDRTEHPCTYVQDFPCDLEALPLTVGGELSWEDRFEQDKPLWDNVTHGAWYWIPQTVFVAVACEGDGGRTGGICILDDNGMHGTGTTSSVLTENEDVLIAFKEGGPGIGMFYEAQLPVDIFSVSWGYIAPIPVEVEGVLDNDYSPIYVLAAGNDPRSVLADSWAGDPRAITVGGAYSADNSQEPLAGNQADVVSYFCRPTAQTNSVDEMRESYCGTSFATPTTAGALSKVVLALRETSGYLGTLEGDMVDPILEISIADLRHALNTTASYDPEPRYPNAGGAGSFPLNPVAPWVQWGWGFYDGDVADATIDHFLVEAAPEKPMEAQLYMQAIYTARETLQG